jgi:hypothetical protein
MFVRLRAWARRSWVGLILLAGVVLVVAAVDSDVAIGAAAGAGAAYLLWRAVRASWTPLTVLPRPALVIAGLSAVAAGALTATVLMDERPLFGHWPLWLWPLPERLIAQWTNAQVGTALIAGAIALILVPRAVAWSWTRAEGWIAEGDMRLAFLVIMLLNATAFALLLAGCFAWFASFDVTGFARWLGLAAFAAIGAGLDFAVWRFLLQERWQRLEQADPTTRRSLLTIWTVAGVALLSGMLAALPVLFFQDLSPFDLNGLVSLVGWGVVAGVGLGTAGALIPVAAVAGWQQLTRLPTSVRRAAGWPALGALAVAGALLLFALPNILRLAAPSGLGGGGSTYNVDVAPVIGDSEQVEATIRATTNSGDQLPPRTLRLHSTSGSGYLVRDVDIPGPQRVPNLCGTVCPAVILKFVDFPKGVVYEVRHGYITRREPFGRTEVVQAYASSIDPSGEDVVFSYVPEPFNVVPAGVLGSFTELPSVQQIFVLLIVGAGMLFVKSAGGAAGSWITDRLKDRMPFAGRGPKPEPMPRPPAGQAPPAAGPPPSGPYRRRGHPARSGAPEPDQDANSTEM